MVSKSIIWFRFLKKNIRAVAASLTWREEKRQEPPSLWTKKSVSYTLHTSAFMANNEIAQENEHAIG